MVSTVFFCELIVLVLLVMLEMVMIRAVMIRAIKDYKYNFIFDSIEARQVGHVRPMPSLQFEQQQ